MPPHLVPTLRPFQNAIAFHRSRVPISDAEFYRLSNEAKLRAFTVSGLARQASITEAYRLVDEAIKSGSTMAEFRSTFTTYLAQNGEALLDESRLNLIFRQNVALAYTVGRYEQMSDPDVLAMRPYWMYPLGPDDDRTTTICRQLQGFVAPADAEVWKHIYPPNHFNERHTQVVSLTSEQAQSTGRIYEGPNSDAYPFVEGQRMLPDSGFDFAPSLVASDDEALLAEIAGIEDLEAKTAFDYGLGELSSMSIDDLTVAPDAIEAVSADDAWQHFRDMFQMPEDLDETIAVDRDGDGLFVNRNTFDRMRSGDAATAVERMALIPAALENPVEIWWLPTRDASGATSFKKRYIGLFRDVTGGELAVVVDRSPGGWLMSAEFPEAGELESFRRGYLAYRSYGRKH
jgi:hypothetical protein